MTFWLSLLGLTLGALWWGSRQIAMVRKPLTVLDQKKAAWKS